MHCRGWVRETRLQAVGERERALGNKALVPDGVTWRLEGQTGGTRALEEALDGR